MVRNKQGFRSLVAFLVTWAFVVLTVTGIVLYIVPQGRIAYWTHWVLAGLEKEEWAAVHMIFGGLFIATGVLHLYFNWKPFKKYLAERVKGHLEFSREVYLSLAITVALIALTVFNLPPASWVLDLNTIAKDAWVTKDLEPPFGHAEEFSLAGLSKRMDIDVDKAMAALKEKGIAFAGPNESLEKIARANGITPKDIYAVMRVFEEQPAPVGDAALTGADVEARFAGKGVGRKSLAEVSVMTGVALETAIARLKANDIAAKAEDTMRGLAEANGTSPIDVMKVILIDGHTL
ncbi:MAG: hypothetical protein C0606_09890 [Hyphomicrobiales bacterium]|mgnify:CR=1 FL=1|nr:MAG: hypothetical protein C0606_09890 [Hyphomicrobiales bacterium]